MTRPGIDTCSLVPLYVEAFFGDQLLGGATAFPWLRFDERLSLGSGSVICVTWRLSLEGLKDLSALADLKVRWCCIGSHKAGRCIDSKRAWWPLCRPSQIVRPCVPSRDTAIGSAREHHHWHRDATSTQASNKVPSRSMACMMTARRRASATRAFRSPRRFAILSAQLFSAKLWRVRVKIELAAS